MALFLNIVQGPLTGDKYEIFEGLKIGRTKGQIKLDDAKASSLHATIDLIDGKFILLDNNSKNGIRQGKERVLSLVLEPGVEFQIGGSHFIVESDLQALSYPDEDPPRKDEAPSPLFLVPEEEVTPPPKPYSADDPPEKEAQPTSVTSSVADELLQSGEVEEITRFEGEQTSVPLEAPEVERRTWSDRLKEWTQESAEKLLDQPKPLAPFSEAIQLNFLRGLQAETSWILGYGPRQAGPRSLDLPIYEPGAPDPCFDIVPIVDGVQFQTSFPDKVLLNGRPVKTGRLKQGDTITIDDSVIEVDFLK